MEIGDWAATPNLCRIIGEIRRLGLERHVTELEAFGFTILEPELVGPASFIDEMAEVTLRVARERGTAPEIGQLNSAATGEFLRGLLWEDPIYERAILNPAALALVTYLLGEGCILQSVVGQLKTHTTERSTVHTDNAMIPPPFPPYAQVANATWVLSDYTKDNGCLMVIPGSHKSYRHPLPDEVQDESKMIPVEARRGSIIVWVGGLWHGAYPKRTLETLRLNVITFFARMHLSPQEPLRYQVTPEALARNPPRFAALLSQHLGYGWGKDEPVFTPEQKMYLDVQRATEARLYG